MEHQLLSLAEVNIEVVPAELANYVVLSRDGFVCLVERRKTDPPTLGPAGSVCKLMSQGFAVVLWDGRQAYFTSKSERQLATADEIVLFRSFAQDLQTALAQ